MSVITYKQSLCTQAIIARFAKERAIVLQAINALKNPKGSTYVELRKWIEENKGFTMTVDARVKELCVIPDPLTGKPYCKRKYRKEKNWKMPKTFVYLNE